MHITCIEGHNPRNKYVFFITLDIEKNTYFEVYDPRKRVYNSNQVNLGIIFQNICRKG